MTNQQKEEQTEMPTAKKMVVVTTIHKGVFAGYPAGAQSNGNIKLTQARMCVYWSQDVHGVVGLAATGPSKDCKVTAAAPSIVLEGVTAVAECTPEATAAWEKGPWR
jgi:hypothetical protein